MAKSILIKVCYQPDLTHNLSKKTPDFSVYFQHISIGNHIYTIHTYMQVLNGHLLMEMAHQKQQSTQ